MSPAKKVKLDPLMGGKNTPDLAETPLSGIEDHRKSSRRGTVQQTPFQSTKRRRTTNKCVRALFSWSVFHVLRECSVSAVVKVAQSVLTLELQALPRLVVCTRSPQFRGLIGVPRACLGPDPPAKSMRLQHENVYSRYLDIYDEATMS